MRAHALRLALALVTFVTAVGAVAAAPAAAALPAGASAYVAVTPQRLADTRPSQGAYGFTTVGASTIRVDILGGEGVPANATAAVVNVTIIGAGGKGYVTVYPSGEGLPTTSTVNSEVAGRTIANMAHVKIGANGSIDLFRSTSMNLAVDLVGVYVPVAGGVSEGRLTTLASGAVRIFDTRDRGYGVGAGSVTPVNLGTAGLPSGQAAALVTQTVKGMGLAVGESARVADVLTKAAASANTNVLGLGQALSYAAPVAQALGLSLEETAALVGKFADAGIDASRAGTALNSILSQFSDPASKFRAELAAAGITTTNFNAALHQLAEAGPAGERAMLAVGQEAGPALRALLNQGVGALDELTGKLKESSGAAQEAAATMNDNLDGAVLGLGSAWEAFKLKLADPVLGVLKDQVQAVTEVIQRFVSSGVATRFGEAISTAFQAGGKWALAFLETLDFDKLIASLKSFASEAQTTFQKIGEYSTTAGAAMQTAWGVMSAGVNSINSPR